MSLCGLPRAVYNKIKTSEGKTDRSRRHAYMQCSGGQSVCVPEPSENKRRNRASKNGQHTTHARDGHSRQRFVFQQHGMCMCMLCTDR